MELRKFDIPELLSTYEPVQELCIFLDTKKTPMLVLQYELRTCVVYSEGA